MPAIPSIFKLASKGETNILDNTAALETMVTHNHEQKRRRGDEISVTMREVQHRQQERNERSSSTVGGLGRRVPQNATRGAEASYTDATTSNKRHTTRYDEGGPLILDEDDDEENCVVVSVIHPHQQGDETGDDMSTDGSDTDDESAASAKSATTSPKMQIRRSSTARPVATVIKGGRKRISKVTPAKGGRAATHPFSDMLLSLTPTLLPNEQIKDVAQNVHLYFDGFWHLGTLYLTLYRLIFKPIVLSSYDDVPKIDNAEEFCSVPLTSVYRVEKVGGKSTRQEHGYLIEIWTKDLKHMRFSFRVPQRMNVNNAMQTASSPSSQAGADTLENLFSDRIRKRFGKHLKKEITIAKFFAYQYTCPPFTLKDVLLYEHEAAMGGAHATHTNGYGSYSPFNANHQDDAPTALSDDILKDMLEEGMSLDDKFDGWEIYNVYMEFGLRQGILCDMESRHHASLVQQRKIRNRLLYGPSGEPPFRKEPQSNAIRNWRTCSLNKNYDISETYPKIFCVPAMMTDEEVRAVAAFRSKGRIPVLCWCNPQTGASLLRSAQPLVGMMMHSITRKSKILDDQRMIELVIGTNPLVKSLMIVDLRPKLNADANKLFKGAGYEKDYTNCDLRFMNIDNIHAMRSSYSKLIEVCINSGGSDMQFFSNVENTKWLEHLRLTLRAALFCVMCIEGEKKSVLVHCSDGWDRSSQCTGLTLIMLDPFYRTLEGFCVLIEKEWCSFGHKFHKRIGPGSKNFFLDERAPIFFQFLECVYQLIHQHPTAFEFTDQFLICLMDEVYGSRFGTFLYDSERERTLHPELDVTKNTPSIWTYVLHPKNRERFVNPLYDSSDRTTSRSIIPDLRKSHIRLWTNYWMRYIVPPNAKILSQRIVNSTQSQMQRYYVYHKAFPVPRDALIACGRTLLSQLKTLNEEKLRADQRNERTITTFQNELRSLWQTIEMLGKEKETLDERYTTDTNLLLRLCDKQRQELRKWRRGDDADQGELKEQAEQVQKLEQEANSVLCVGSIQQDGTLGDAEESGEVDGLSIVPPIVVPPVEEVPAYSHENPSIVQKGESGSSPVSTVKKQYDFHPAALGTTPPSQKVERNTQIIAQLRALYETKMDSLCAKHNLELEEQRTTQHKEFSAMKRQLEKLQRENIDLASTVKQQQEKLTEIFPAPPTDDDLEDDDDDDTVNDEED